jgi:hypothetical protein
MTDNGKIRVLLPGPTSYLGRRLMLKLLDRHAAPADPGVDGQAVRFPDMIQSIIRQAERME